MKIKISCPHKETEQETLLTHCFSGRYVDGYPSVIIESFNDPQLTIDEGLTLSYYMFKYFSEVLWDKLVEQKIQNLEVMDCLKKVRTLLAQLEHSQQMASTTVN